MIFKYVIENKILNNFFLYTIFVFKIFAKNDATTILNFTCKSLTVCIYEPRSYCYSRTCHKT